MNTSTEVGGTSFGTTEMQMGGALGTMTRGSVNREMSGFAESDKISLMELGRALDVIGEMGKTYLMNYIQFYNPRTGSDGCVKLDMVHDVLHEFFGEAAVLLMREIQQ
jgi:hypothetical protein